MKFQFAAALLLVAVLVVSFANANQIDSSLVKKKSARLETVHNKNSKHMSFEEFKRVYDRKYETHQEETRRRSYFEDHLKEADYMKKINPEADFGVNGLADLSPAEFKSLLNQDGSLHRGGLARDSRPAHEQQTQKQVDELLLADSAAGATFIDWTALGAVTNIKNQGSCGSCWSFSTTASVEGQHFLQTGTLVSLSEQELVSCDIHGKDHGCSGGEIYSALGFILEKGGITSEEEYPYVSGNKHVPYCNMFGKSIFANITGRLSLQKNNEPAMAAYLFKNGPISISVFAQSWKTYKGGIMTAAGCQAFGQHVDHGVAAVGFNKEYEGGVWFVKNSWTAKWGIEGYIWLQYDTDTCLISFDPVAAVAPHNYHPTPSPSGPPSPPTMPPTFPPPPPSPTAPTPVPPAPTPAPPAPAASFELHSCGASTDCLEACITSTHPQKTCVSLNGTKVSAKVTCNSAAQSVSVVQYDNVNCAGSGKTRSIGMEMCAVSPFHAGNVSHCFINCY